MTRDAMESICRTKQWIEPQNCNCNCNHLCSLCMYSVLLYVPRGRSCNLNPTVTVPPVMRHGNDIKTIPFRRNFHGAPLLLACTLHTRHPGEPLGGPEKNMLRPHRRTHNSFVSITRFKVGGITVIVSPWDSTYCAMLAHPF